MNENNGLNENSKNTVQNTETIDLLDLGRRLFIPRNVFIIVMAGLLAGIIGFLYSKYVIPEMFASSTMVYVSNNNSIVISDEINTQTISSNRTLAKSGVVLLQSDYIMEKVGSTLMDLYPMSELKENFVLYEDADGETKITIDSIVSCFSVEPVDNTEVLRVTALTKNARLSSDMCNILVDMAPDFLKSIIGGGTVEAIGKAHPAIQNSSPDMTENALSCLLAAAMAVTGAFILKILMDGKIRTSENFKNKFDFPVFDEIPYIEKFEEKEDRQKNETIDSDNDILDGSEAEQSFRLTEIFNTLANNLAGTLSMNDEKVVVISSPDENDGKSTVSVNLAKSMAKLGKKVLLIDLDLRKGTIHKKIKIANKNGIIDIIGKDADFDSCIRKNVLEGLDVLLTGGTSPNSIGILSSRKMQDFIKKCKERYDIIVIDSPPVNVVSDACVIAQYAADMAVVVRANQTSFDDVNRLIENATRANCKIIGFIINFADGYTGSGYYKNKHYSYGYGYYGTQKAEEAPGEPKNTSKQKM